MKKKKPVKVYVITYGHYYEGSDVFGIYSSREIAEQELEKYKKDGTNHYDYVDIAEYELDKGI